MQLAPRPIKSLARSLVCKILHHCVMWDGTDEYGEGVASGMHVYRLWADDFVIQKKLVVMR